MGSAPMPIPGSFNPTGAFTGTSNPNYAAETFKMQQMNVIPGGGNPQSVPLGNNGPNVFSPAATASPATTAPPVPQTWAPGMPITPLFGQGASPSPAAPNSGLTFGFPNAGSPTTAIPGVIGKAANGVPSALGLPVPGGGALSKQWGSMGPAINDFIKNGMGFNPQVAGMMANDITPYFQANMNNLMEMFGAAGGRYSSDAALAGGQMTASFTAQQQQIFTQMYQQAVQNYLQVLTGGRYKQGGGGLMSTISSALGIASSAGSAASAGLGMEAGAGTGETIAAILAAL